MDPFSKKDFNRSQDEMGINGWNNPVPAVLAKSGLLGVSTTRGLQRPGRRTGALHCFSAAISLPRRSNVPRSSPAALGDQAPAGRAAPLRSCRGQPVSGPFGARRIRASAASRRPPRRAAVTDFPSGEGTKRVLEGNSTAPLGSSVTLPAPENMQALTSTQWHLLRGNTSQEPPVGPQSSFVSPLENLRLSMALEDSLQISVSALVFAVFCGWGILIPICQPRKLRIRGTASKWLSIYANGLVCLASALALVSLLLWIHEQGLSAALIVPILVLLYVILVTMLLVATVAFELSILHQVTDKAGQRVLNITTPGGMILAAVTSSLLIKQICLLQEKRNAEPVDLTAVIAGASGISLFPLIAIIVLYCMDLRKQEAEDRIFRREKQRELEAILEMNL